jgi:LPS sulfotransferase NodH
LNETRAGLRNESLATDHRFVILGTQRTGTILLMGLLDSHPEIACIGELFQHRADYVQHSVPRYRLYVTSSPKNRILDLVARRSLAWSYLDSVFVTFDTPVVGFKLMIDQAIRFPSVVDYLKTHDFKIIGIVRQNLLKTHISRLRALETGVYLSTDQADRVRLQVPIDSLVEELVALERENEVIQRTLTRLGLDYRSVTYESISGLSRDSELQRLLSFLDVDPNVHLEPQSTKITPDDLSQAIANYEEVTSILKGTAYQQFLS